MSPIDGHRGSDRSASAVRPYVKTLGQPSKSGSQRVVRLAALPNAPKLARLFVAQAAVRLRIAQPNIEVAELLVSELVTNAVARTGRVDGPAIPRPAEHVAVVAVRVRVAGEVLGIDVWDCDPTMPVLCCSTVDDESGHGLMLVEALAARWGAYPVTNRALGTAGKVVWAEVATSVEASHG